MRKGQVSVFIIFAIILVITGVAVYFITINNQKNVDDYFNLPEIKTSVDNIKDSISDCIKYTSIDALDIIGVQGGYYNKPKEAYDIGFATVPYYYKQGNYYMPEISFIEKEIESYVDYNLASCIDEIKAEGFKIMKEEPQTKAFISKGIVTFTIDMSVTISKEQKSIVYELKESPYKKDSKLFEILEVAKYITDSHKESPDSICINCVADMAEERGIYADMVDFVDNSTLIVLSEKTTSENPYYFEFLNKY